jgi:hypothetical protein
LIKPMDGQILITNLSTEDEEDAKPLSEGDMGL